MDTDAGSLPPEGARSPSPARQRSSSTDAGAQKREARAALAQRTAPLWPAHATVEPHQAGATRGDYREAYRLAGLELQHHALVLRQITTAYVVAVAKPCFEAGWSIADILHALDWTPTGQRYPHDSVAGIAYPGAWFAARLRTWTHQDGTPMRSVDQRAAAAADQRRAEAIAAAQRHAQRQAARHPAAGASRSEAGGGGTGVAVGAEGTPPVGLRPLKERFAAAYAAGLAEAADRSRKGQTGR